MNQLPIGFSDADPARVGTVPSLDLSTLRDYSSALKKLEPEWPITWIRTPQELAALVEKLKLEKIFIVDTETGRKKAEEPLNAHLALIQIGIFGKGPAGELSDKNGETFLIDMLALEEHAEAEIRRSRQDVNPLEPLRSVMQDAAITKLAYFIQFEREQFGRYDISIEGGIDVFKTSKELRPPFKFPGSSEKWKDMASNSFAASKAEFEGIFLSKEEQKSSWLQRPLEPGQEKYAALDVEGLASLYLLFERLKAELKINPNLSVDEHLGAIVEEREKGLKLIRGELGNEVWLRRVQVKAIEERIGELLLARMKADEAEEIWHSLDHNDCADGLNNGSAGWKSRAKRELDVKLFKERYPEIAKKLLKDTAKKADAQKALLAAGVAKADAQELLDLIFISEGRTAPSLSVAPAFGRIYGQPTERETKKFVEMQARKYGLDALDVAEIVELARRFRPDLPSYSLKACALEITGAVLADPSAASEAERAGNAQIISDLHERLRSFVSRVVVNPRLGVEELLGDIIRANGEALGMMRAADRGSQYAATFLRIEAHKEALKAKLIPELEKSGEHSYSAGNRDGNGEAIVATRPRNPQFKPENMRKLAAEVRDVVKTVVQKGARIGDIVKELKAAGFSGTDARALVRTLQKDAGRSDPTLRVYPRNSKLYGREDFIDEAAVELEERERDERELEADGEDAAEASA